MSDTQHRITATSIPYVCRVCGRETKVLVRVEPDADNWLNIQADGRHRLASVDCRECGVKRPHVIRFALAEWRADQ